MRRKEGIGLNGKFWFRIAVSEKFYRENEKLLEGGMWAEVTIAHNEIEEDDYAFYVEDLRPEDSLHVLMSRIILKAESNSLAMNGWMLF